jgi:hypothetical protein
MNSFSIFAIAATAATVLASPALSEEKVCAEVRTECVGGACAEKCIPSSDTPADSTVGSGVRSPAANPNGLKNGPPPSVRDPASGNNDPATRQLPDSANPNGR